MAELQAEPGRAEAVASIRTIVNLSGGLVSIGLVVAVGVWGYRTMVRDVSDVPVVHAAKDPMRVAPEDPGGALGGNMGLAVNKVAADGLAENPADRLILAPAPVRLSPEDESSRVMQEIIAAEERAARAQEAADAGLLEDGDSAAEAEPEGTDALVARLMKDAEPFAPEKLQAVSADTDIARALLHAQEQIDSEAVTEEEPTEAAFTPESDDIPVQSLRPRMRPGANSPTGPEVMIAAPTPIQPSLDVDPATIEPGTRLAQLGAYDSVETANKEWDRFAARFRDYMTDKKRVIQKASSGGRTFYRLRVMGFDDIAEARYFCAALLAEKAECIPVVFK